MEFNSHGRKGSHRPHNRLLVRFRELQGTGSSASRAADWKFYGVARYRMHGMATPDECEHAEKVLTRLIEFGRVRT